MTALIASIAFFLVAGALVVLHARVLPGLGVQYPHPLYSAAEWGCCIFACAGYAAALTPLVMG